MIRSIIYTTLVLSLAGISVARELGEPNLSDDEFLARFTASYGVLSEKEPPLNDLEIVMLKKIAPLIRINKEQAQNVLQSMTSSEEEYSASFNYLLGNIYFENEEFLLAEEQYKLSIERYPDFQRAWTNLGVLKLRSGDTASALFAFLKAVELGDSKSETFGMLGYCHYAEGNYISAEVAYNRAVLAEPNNLDWLEGKAQTYLKAERYIEAIRMQDELIARRPRESQYWLAQTNAYIGLGDFDQAARNLEIVRSLNEADFNSLHLLGSLYARLEMFGPARDAYSDAVRFARPGDTAFLLNASKLFIRADEYDAAQELINLFDPESVELSKSDQVDFHSISADLARHDGDLEEAIEHLTSAEKLDPTNGKILIKLAKISTDQEDRDRAYLLLDRAELDPETEYEAIITRVKMLLDEQRFRESQTFVKRALELRSNAATQILFEQVESAARETAIQ